MTIRQAQLAAFGNVARMSFEQRLQNHLTARYPRVGERFGAKRVNELIALGIDRARKYGFKVEADVANYCDLMFRFGPEFDRGVRSSWARPHLNNRNEAGSLRMQRILVAAQQNRQFEINPPSERNMA